MTNLIIKCARAQAKFQRVNGGLISVEDVLRIKSLDTIEKMIIEIAPSGIVTSAVLSKKQEPSLQQLLLEEYHAYLSEELKVEKENTARQMENDRKTELLAKLIEEKKNNSLKEKSIEELEEMLKKYL